MKLCRFVGVWYDFSFYFKMFIIVIRFFIGLEILFYFIYDKSLFEGRKYGICYFVNFELCDVLIVLIVFVDFSYWVWKVEIVGWVCSSKLL